MGKETEAKTVIVADDDRFIVDAARELLEGSSFKVTGEAANGLDLIKACEEKRPDIVLADIEMPVMDGIQAAEELISRNLTKCVVMLTSFDDEKYVEGAIEAGAAGYLTKPLEKEVLIPTLKSCFRKSVEMYDMNKKVANISKRIETRSVIEKAQLLLMEKHEMSEGDAYIHIKALSKERNTSMAEIAEMVIAKYDK